MNFRTPLIVACSATCAATLACVFAQGRQLGELRAEHQRLVIQQEGAKKNSTEAAPKNESTGSPSIELLRLRNEVSQLTSRRRELNNVTSENEKLLVQVAASRTNPAKAAIVMQTLPPGYISKATARNVGYNSPEDALQTMLWALQNRDAASIAQGFTPRIAEDFQKQIAKAQAAGKDFFAASEKLPGMLVLGKEQEPDGATILRVEIIPGEPETKIRFQQINGQWKLDSK